MNKKLFYIGTFLIIQLIFIYLDNQKFKNFLTAENEIQLTCFHEVGHFIISECDVDSTEFVNISIIPDSIKNRLGITNVYFYETTSQEFQDKMYLSGICTEYLFSDKKFNLNELYLQYNFKTIKKNADEYKVSIKEDSVKIKGELFKLYFDLKSKEKEILAYSIILHDEKKITNLFYFNFLKNRLKLSNKIIKLWKSIF